MKILQVIPYFYPAYGIGGTSDVVLELSKYLVKNNHQVTIYTTDLQNSAKRLDVKCAKEVNIKGIKVFYFKNLSNKLAFDKHLFIPLGFFHSFYSQIKNFDLVHFHELYTLQNIWGGLICLRNNIPYIVSSHSTAHILEQAGRVRQKQIFNFLVGSTLLKKAAKLIALNKQEKNAYLKLGAKAEDIKIIPNGINTSQYSKRKKTAKKMKTLRAKARTFSQDKMFSYCSEKTSGSPFNSKLKLRVFSGTGIKKEKNTFYLLFLGRIHRKKGIHIVVDSLKKLTDKGILAKLILAGQMDDRSYFSHLLAEIKKKNLEKQVIFTGVLKEAEKKAILNLADVFVLPSFGEGMSISILEAGISQLPLVISNKCHLPEVEKFQAGFVVKNGKDEYFKVLKQIYHDKKMKKKMGENAKKLVQEKFSVDIMAKKTESLYRDVIRQYLDK